VAATGWIGIRGDSVAAAEVEAGLAAEVTWRPTRVLADFFGPQATMHGFRLEKYQGP
jgi:ubiquinone biosynthesis protein UbiJ